MNMIDRHIFDEMWHKAESAGNVTMLKQLYEMQNTGMVGVAIPQVYPAQKIQMERDTFSNRDIVKIDVQAMVQNLLGGFNPNRDVQVGLEKYGNIHGQPIEDHLMFVVINLCNLKTGDIITLRERYSKFPSSELLTKLELLRVGDATV